MMARKIHIDPLEIEITLIVFLIHLQDPDFWWYIWKWIKVNQN